MNYLYVVFLMDVSFFLLGEILVINNVMWYVNKFCLICIIRDCLFFLFVFIIGVKKNEKFCLMVYKIIDSVLVI